jgi:trans-aconitate methyltransferase
MISAAQLLTLLVDVVCIAACGAFIRSVVLAYRRAPFIPTHADAAEEIAALIGGLPRGSVVYDLGCGDGRVLRALVKRNPNAAYIGVERQIVPYVIAKLRCSGFARIVRGDLFAQDLSAATHVFLFLYGHVLDALLPKLERELAPGTWVYSLDFTFNSREPQQRIMLRSRANRTLGTVLHVYEF